MIPVSNKLRKLRAYRANLKSIIKKNNCMNLSFQKSIFYEHVRLLWINTSIWRKVELNMYIYIQKSIYWLCVWYACT